MHKMYFKNSDIYKENIGQDTELFFYIWNIPADITNYTALKSFNNLLCLHSTVKSFQIIIVVFQ